MAVFISDEDAFHKISFIEGDSWFSGSSSPLDDFSSVFSSWRNRDEDDYFEDSVIYGASGMRRYIVDSNGEIFYSRSHDSATAPLAENLGFRLC